MSVRHHDFNDLVARSFGFRLSKSFCYKIADGAISDCRKRPHAHGVTFVPWQSGKSLCWDVTDTCPLAEAYCRLIEQLLTQAQLQRSREHVVLGARYFFEPVAVETLGVFYAAALPLRLIVLKGGFLQTRARLKRLVFRMGERGRERKGSYRYFFFTLQALG